ncbi:hypothetical protein M406DRAFT_74152 [Cryphonectria parasitica EP155]|uniref:Uncharacterized protein n=1 Tax=Cryphonectria parasitica (strain ATCC 38755 / EP155) TaxID=660469 RepID=A0A9P5CLY3_CRYP1|nr:uncharacterized protein M406DRAFT_74152 [Cryphonectria parasitica EP155]KAF3763563.1 hypothetical protein M406DRAFT_74152 [Cryphonectria parasitica EP155]
MSTLRLGISNLDSDVVMGEEFWGNPPPNTCNFAITKTTSLAMSYRVSGSDSKKLVQLKEVAKQDAGEGTRRPADSEEHNRGSAVGEFHEPLVHSANEPLELDKHIRELAAIDNTEDRAQPEQQAEKPAFDHNINLPPQLKDKMPVVLVASQPSGHEDQIRDPRNHHALHAARLVIDYNSQAIADGSTKAALLEEYAGQAAVHAVNKAGQPVGDRLAGYLIFLLDEMIEALFKPISNPSLQARMMFPDPQCLASPPAFLMRQTFVQQAHEAKAKHRGHVTLAAMQDPGVPGQSVESAIQFADPFQFRNLNTNQKILHTRRNNLSSEKVTPGLRYAMAKEDYEVRMEKAPAVVLAREDIPDKMPALPPILCNRGLAAERQRANTRMRAKWEDIVWG